jgi:hypothetical protein
MTSFNVLLARTAVVLGGAIGCADWTFAFQ